MRVLRIAHHGVVSAWRERERRLRSLGLDVAMLSARQWNEGGRDLKLDAEGDTFVRGVRTFGTHPNAFIYAPMPIWRALRAGLALIDLHEEPYALATAQTLFLRKLRRSSVPYILYSAQNIEKRHPIPFRWFERWALRGAAAAYVCNREAGEILVRKGLVGPVRLIPLGVDTTVYSPSPRTEVQELPLIAYFGRLEQKKGVDTLIRAAAARPNWRVEITGEGPQRAELESLAQQLGTASRVAFLGFAQDAELAERYRRADIVAIPSIPWPGWLEQFCRVAVEAMASGVPVVASRSGAIPDVVGNAGILVAPGDPVALTAGIDSALQPAVWQELRARGVERARQFTWDAVAREQEALYREIVPTRDSGRGRRPQVVVVAYGDPEMLEGALEELGEGHEVTIVDNSSAADTRALAMRRGAHYVDPGRNLGFGAGVNVALRSLAERGRADDDVLLLNPDARISAAGVETMHSLLHAQDKLAVVGATQTEPETGDTVRVWWPFPAPSRAWLEAVGLGRLNRAHGFVIGSILLLRAEAIREVGFFDERFFLYAEEVDWQKRARDAGWDIRVAAVSATHIGAGTGGSGEYREALFFASNEAFQRKHFGAFGWQSFRLAMIVGATVRGVVLPGDRGRNARRRRRIFLQGPARYLQTLS